MLKMLDCFCGMGGVSDGFAMEGFDVTGIDIIDAPKMFGYKYRFIKADIEDCVFDNFPCVDVDWGSPPCRNWSQMAHVGHGSKCTDSKGKWAWKNPPNPYDLTLVNAFLTIVQRMKPKIWIMENTPNLEKYLAMKPQMITRIEPTKKRAFWGNFPSLTVPMSEGLSVAKNVKGRIYCIQGKYRSWQRAKIPLACSQAFAKACREALSPPDSLQLPLPPEELTEPYGGGPFGESHYSW